MWLAERGWHATGADLSVVALEKARKHADEAGVAERTDWVHVDLLAGDPLPGDADLVSAMFVHVPEADFDRVYATIAGAVRSGGTLLVAGHHPAERDTDLRNPRLSHLLFAAGAGDRRCWTTAGGSTSQTPAPATCSGTTANRGSRQTRWWWRGGPDLTPARPGSQRIHGPNGNAQPRACVLPVEGP